MRVNWAFFPLLPQKMAELCQNRKQGKMGLVRLNNQHTLWTIGGVPVSEDTSCPPPPSEALKHISHMEKHIRKVGLAQFGPRISKSHD